MHPRDNQLRAMIDQELPESQAGAVRRHIAGCRTCQARLAALRERAERVQGRLNLLSPEAGFNQRQARAKFHHILEKSRQIKPKKEYLSPMSNRKTLWTALAVVVILAVVFTMTPASAWASSFLGLFRVQKITVLEFDKLAAENSGEAISSQEEVINRLLDENLTITDEADPYEVASLDEAAAAIGFSPSIPDALAGGTLFVQPSMHGELVIDQPQMQALLDAFDIDAQIPASVDGQSVTVDVPAGLVITDGCEMDEVNAGKFGTCTALYQMPSPTVNAPEGLNVDKFGEALLQMLGYSPMEARAFSQNIDWTSTLLVPVPAGEGILHEEVSVGGVTGTLFTHEQEPGYVLMWVKDGMLYGLSGPGSGEQAVEIGNAVP